MTEKTALQILTEARDQIQKPYGWVRGYLKKDVNRSDTDTTCAVCAVGGVCLAADVRNEWSLSSHTAARQAIDLLYGALPRAKSVSPTFQQQYAAIEAYNDSGFTSKRDIINLFNRAIKEASNA